MRWNGYFTHRYPMYYRGMQRSVPFIGAMIKNLVAIMMSNCVEAGGGNYVGIFGNKNPSHIKYGVTAEYRP